MNIKEPSEGNNIHRTLYKAKQVFTLKGSCRLNPKENYEIVLSLG